MKIAIITYSRAYNYGSALQTYALNKYLTTEGYEVQTIDYTTEGQRKLYTLFEPVRGLLPIMRNLQSILHLKALRQHKKRFDSFLNKYVPMTDHVYSDKDLMDLNEKFDFFICGSDQVWNTLCEDYNSNYMLSFVKDKSKCLSYAPSLGSGLDKKETYEQIKKYVSPFKAISCREDRGVNVAKEATNRHVEKVLDPVYLLNSESWSMIAPPSPILGDYILGYFIGDIEGMREFAKKMSNELDLPVVVICKSLRDIGYGFKLYYEAGPQEFVTLLSGAKYIVTNSFHAVSYSLIFHKNFWVFINKITGDSRIESILSLVGLKERIVDVESQSVIDVKRDIDYTDAIGQRLQNEINKSKNFLLKNLNG